MSGFSQNRPFNRSFNRSSNSFSRGEGRVIVSFQRDFGRQGDEESAKDSQAGHVQNVGNALRKLKKISLVESILKEHKEKKYFVSNSELKTKRIKNAKKKCKMARSQNAIVKGHNKFGRSKSR